MTPNQLSDVLVPQFSLCLTLQDGFKKKAIFHNPLHGCAIIQAKDATSRTKYLSIPSGWGNLWD